MLIVLPERMGKTMLEETKNYLNQLIIDLHYNASLTKNLELRKIADDINEIIKKDEDVTFRL
jgi:hypothetical protein